MPNRLIHASSPYLLQHAHNPVDWYEWGKEALDKAIAEDKPILVSIGYSSCHWCHVMERESFEDKDIADLMNEFFVCIKVDREERPDIDQVYMDAVQAMRQSGGWPLNVFLTPDQKPFYGGTYFPPQNWVQLLLQIRKAFRERRQEINESAEDLKNHLQTSDLHRFAKEEHKGFTTDRLMKMFYSLAARYDKTWGGIEKAPKFVMPSIWHFLLRYYKLTSNQESLNMVTHTLKQVAYGGIYDQLAGGFSRYSVDREWFAPHFEKMLYDNAQLLSLYSEAYAITKEPLFRDVIYETVDWIRNEMTHPGGGFYSALDADSEGVEGKFYTWTTEEIKEALGADADRITSYYHVTPEGNWEHGRNILKRGHASQLQPAPESLHVLKQKLLMKRKTRVRPGLDDKILTGWNAMTIQGLLDAYKATADDLFLMMALENISFLESFLIVDGKVYRAFKHKHSETEAFLEDYAYLVQAYTSLYQVTFNEGWLHKAEYWCTYVIRHFYDSSDGYFHFSSQSAEQLIAKRKEIFDNVIPASNSVMAHNLFLLGNILDREEWKKLAEKMISRLSDLIESEPSYMSNWGILMAEISQGITEIAISGEEALNFRQQMQQHFLPFSIWVGARDKSDLPLLAGREAKQGQSHIYVCQNKTCRLPVSNPSDALAQLS